MRRSACLLLLAVAAAAAHCADANQPDAAAPVYSRRLAQFGFGRFGEWPLSAWANAPAAGCSGLR